MGLWNLIRRMDAKRMRQTVEQVAKQARRPSPVIFCDVVWCGLRYQAGYMDYALFHFWELNAAQRASVLTRGKNNKYVAALNDRAYWDSFDVKPNFLRLFAPYVRRPWLDLAQAGPEELKALGEKEGALVVKPPDGTHGDGVELLSTAGIADWEGLYKSLTGKGQTLCEGVIPQHEGMDRLWPGSINTVRVVTILAGGEAHVVATYLRVGSGPRPVDNFNSGGMVTPVDKDTGVVQAPARDKAGTLYENHPGTGVAFVGFRIPLWDQIMDLVRKAAPVVPQVRYVGWDVAVTPDGPELVEGNCYPGHDIYGLPGQNPGKMGILPALDAVVPYKSL